MEQQRTKRLLLVTEILELKSTLEPMHPKAYLNLVVDPGIAAIIARSLVHCPTILNHHRNILPHHESAPRYLRLN